MKRMGHVGIAVNDIEASLKRYVDMLGLAPWDKGIVNIPEKGLKVVLLAIGNNNIELLQPNGLQHRSAKFRKERGEGLFHITLESDDYDNDIKRLKEKGYAVEEEVTRSLFPGHAMRLAWLTPKSTDGIWIEIFDLASVPDSFRKRH